MSTTNQQMCVNRQAIPQNLDQRKTKRNLVNSRDNKNFR